MRQWWHHSERRDNVYYSIIISLYDPKYLFYLYLPSDVLLSLSFVATNIVGIYKFLSSQQFLCPIHFPSVQFHLQDSKCFFNSFSVNVTQIYGNIKQLGFQLFRISFFNTFFKTSSFCIRLQGFIPNGFHNLILLSVPFYNY